MGTDVWLRNPLTFIAAAEEAGLNNYIWREGWLIRQRISVDRLLAVRALGIPWRSAVVEEHQVVEWDYQEGSYKDPVSVWPIWRFDVHDPDDLEKMCSKYAKVYVLFGDQTIPANRDFASRCVSLQADYGIKIHVHGATTARPILLGYAGMDIDLLPPLRTGRMFLPNGRIAAHRELAEWRTWVNLLGYKTSKMKTQADMLTFNLHSLRWMGENLRRNLTWRTRGFKSYDPVSLQPRVRYHELPVTSAARRRAVNGDMILCDECSLQYTCQSYRYESICNLPGTDTSDLVLAFGSRDADTVVGALGGILAKQSERMAKAIAKEEDKDEIDPEVTKGLNQLFDRALALAKLLRETGKKPGEGAIDVESTDPKELATEIVAQLREKGFEDEQITDELIAQLLTQTAEERAALIADL